MQKATYGHVFDGRSFEVPIGRQDTHRLEIIELGLRASFALAQENESRSEARSFLLLGRFVKGVR